MPRTKRFAAAVLGVAALALSPALVAAAPLDQTTIYQPIGFFTFCADAQVKVANIDEAMTSPEEKDIRITNQVRDEFSDFVSMKSSADPDAKTINTGQYVEYRDAERTQPEQIRCKMRTGESIDEGAWPEGAVNGVPPWNVPPHFGLGSPLGDDVSTSDVDQACSAVNDALITNVWASLSPEDQAASPYQPGSTLVTVPDDAALTGAAWTQPFPALQLNGAVLEVPSKALLAPVGVIDTPFFEGAHYCTHPAPDYLRAVLLGQATVS